MDELLKEMGLRLQDLREISGFTREGLAMKLGISAEEYTAYENGEKDFSFSFMFNVASLLGVDVFNLLSGKSPKLSDCAVVKKGQEFFIKKEGEYDYKHLGFTFKDKKSEPFLVTEMPSDAKVEFHSHHSQEFNYVLSGKMRFFIGDLSYDLEEGDSVYFNSNIPHGTKVLGDKPVQFIAVVMK